ncbi:hemolysin family protein [Fuerstiella marisgermanici]|uniref:Magnesium and cobalt efflux protein CorC n=1 Tax=Fuerstiella marisgermanici TaxID=1891926 RepID=A0A1P8WSH9_9PLAN|nr:hemolysin family protein [Fuerstiella marisgermanici]APZ97006.1 Magnesium and cobalt efflux protein CorC [Fuerstiella marisgermanici]
MSALLPIVFGLALTLLFVFLTLTCFSLRDFSRSRLEEICRQHRKLKRFGAILQNHHKLLLLSELLLLLTGCLSLSAAFSSPYFQSFLPPESADWPIVVLWLCRISAIVLTGGLLFVLLPWTIARVRGEALLYHFWPLFSVAGKLGTPVWHFAVNMDRMVHRVFGVPEPSSEQIASLLTGELLTVVDESQREGVIHSSTSTMIRRVVDLQTEDVAAIMTPRTDMVTIPADTRLAAALSEMLQNGFSRVPVIREGIDDIVGILYVRDLLAYASEANDNNGVDSEDARTVHDIARDVLYAPESQGIGDLLEAMRQQKVHMAVIVDEYSGVSGLVTLEDILEEIVGEISDEYDSDDDTLWKSHTEGCTEVDARYHLDDLNEEFGYSFPEDEEFDTIGGFALACFGRIPVAGDEHYCNGIKLTVLEADERRLIRLRIEGDTNPPAVDPNQAVSA